MFTARTWSSVTGRTLPWTNSQFGWYDFTVHGPTGNRLQLTGFAPADRSRSLEQARVELRLVDRLLGAAASRGRG